MDGQHYEFAFYGTNPFMYNDKNKKIIYGPNGIPEGLNGGMATGMAKMYNFTFNVTTFTVLHTVNETTGNTTGGYAEVILSAQVMEWLDATKEKLS